MPIVFRTPSTLCDKRKQPPTSNLPNHFCAQTFIDTGLQSRQMEANQSIDGPWGRPWNQRSEDLVQIAPRNCRLPSDRAPSSGSFYGPRGSKMHWNYSHQCNQFTWSSGSQVRIFWGDSDFFGSVDRIYFRFRCLFPRMALLSNSCYCNCRCLHRDTGLEKGLEIRTQGWW